jgi:hypothetical protein
MLPLLAHLVAVAYMGLLIVDFTVFVLTIARSVRLRTHSEPFLHRLFIDGAFITYLCHLISQHYDITQAFSIMGM